MTKLVPVTCPKCKNPVYSKDVDNVILCPTCGAMQSRDGKVDLIDYEAGAFTRPGDGEKVYLPFWKLEVSYSIMREDVKGGMISMVAHALGGNANNGVIPMMLPAFELEPLRFKELAKSLTLNAPKLTPAPLEPGVRREPCTVTLDMTDEMADFLFVTIEAEEPGVLQSLSYELKVLARKMVYLPYYRKGNELVPGY
ncbi:hypothetical protein [Methanocella conradii]|uniref:hypothetical protein n=1 Tax=Methanocella conradii TaxID=1175444 RepID=UPI00157C5662|nr:hypothetical protein [Methanocella conradii]